MIQSKFGKGWHDSLQYHVMCGDKLFAVRVFWTETLWHHSVWLYDGGVRELLNSTEPLRQSGQDYADLSGSAFRLSAPDAEGIVEVNSGSADDALTIHFKPRNTFPYTAPLGPAVHQADLDCTVTYQGQTHSGLGFCKRYHFDERVSHWGYRFVHGALDDSTWALWSADANFGYHRYGYFKYVTPEGSIHDAKPEDSVHRQEAIYGVVDGTRYEVALEELGIWETRLLSPAMDSQMRQRFCRMTLKHDGVSEMGYAINETCFGTLG